MTKWVYFCPLKASLLQKTLLSCLYSLHMAAGVCRSQKVDASLTCFKQKSCLWVSGESYLRGKTVRQGPAGQISLSGAPSQTGFPKGRVSSNWFQSPVKSREDWTKLVSRSVVIKRDRKWWGAAVPTYTHYQSIQIFPPQVTLHIQMGEKKPFLSVFCSSDVLSDTKAQNLILYQI